MNGLDKDMELPSPDSETEEKLRAEAGSSAASCCALRAKDMAEAFKKSPDAETAAKLASRMVIETSELAKRRKVSTNAGLISIWKELDERWRAFARRCPEIKADGFRIALKAAVPDSTMLKWY